MKALTEAIQVIPSFWSTKYGYIGMVVTPEDYVLTGEQPWQYFADPGYHSALEGTASKQRDRETQYQAAKAIFISQENVCAAINKALTAAAPTTFRRLGGAVAPPVYTATDNPGAILLDLQRRYGKTTPSEKNSSGHLLERTLESGGTN